MYSNILAVLIWAMLTNLVCWIGTYHSTGRVEEQVLFSNSSAKFFVMILASLDSSHSVDSIYIEIILC